MANGDIENSREVILSLGSNLGDRLLFLREALQQLELNPQLLLTAVSSVYETEPQGFTAQPAFYNIAVKLKTSLEPLDLLALCQEVEEKFQRQRTIRWGPRTIDIDIIIFDQLELDLPQLQIPHPRMQERDFVLLPMKELETGQVQASQTVRPIYSGWFKIGN